MEEKRDNGIPKSAARKTSRIGNRFLSSKEISGIGSIGTMRLLKGRAAKALNYLGRIFAYSSSRSYGCFFLSFGLLTILLNLGEYYFVDVPVSVYRQLIFGISMMVFAVPFMFSDKPLCIAFQNFSLTDYLFFEFFTIKRMHVNYDGITVPPVIAFILGFIPAVLGFFLPLGYVVLGVALLIFITVAFTSPEFPMLLSLLLLPYLSLIPGFKVILAALSLLTFLSFILKVILGKRVFNLDIYSVIIFLWMAVALIRSAVSGTFLDSLTFVALLLGYFPAANLIVNRRLADRAMKAIIVSAIPIAVLAITEFIVELPSTHYSPSNSAPGISVNFSSPAALSAYLFVAALLTLAFSLEKKHRAKKIAYFVIFLIDVFIVFLAMEPVAWLSVILTSPLYFILTSKKFPRDVVFLIYIAAHLVFIIPPSLFDGIYSTFGFTHTFSDELAMLSGAFEVFTDKIWWGVGVSSESMLSTGANTILGIGIEFGIFVLALFVLMIVLRLRQLSIHERLYSNSLVSDAIHMTSLASLCLLFFGIGDYIFADTALTFIFFTIFGISSAAMRTAKREHDDRFGYYSDAGSLDFAATDVSVKG